MFKKILNLPIFLSLALFTGSGLAFADCTYTDATFAAAKAACAKDPAKEWSCSTNSCVTSKESVERRKDYQACVALAESTDAEKAAKKACFDKVAKTEAQEKGVKNDKIKDANPVGSGVYGLALSLAAINTFSAKNSKSSCTSSKIMAASALASLAAEVSQYHLLKNKLDKLKKDYSKGVLITGAPYEAQIKAFEYLRDEQKAIADAAKMKALGYGVLTAGYTAAMGVAVFEAVTKGPASTCSTGDSKGKTKDIKMEKQPQEEATDSAKDATSFIPSRMEQVVALGFHLLFPEVLAGAGKNYASLLGGAATGLSTLLNKTIEHFFKTPVGIATISGVCAGVSAALTVAATKEKSRAEENAKKVEKIIAQFKSDLAKFCPAKGARDDINNPECFCYNADRTKNTSRSNSATCNKYWAWKDHDYSVAAGSYTATNTSSYGCIDLNKQVDSSCACKKVVNTKTGSNGCLKSNITASDIGSLGSIGNLSQLNAGFESAYEGNLATSGLSGSNFEKYAANMNRAVDSLLSKNPQLGLSSNPSGNKNLIDKVVGSLATPQTLASAKDSILGPNAGLSEQRAAVPGVEEAIKRSGLDETLSYIGGSGQAKKAAESPSFNIPSLGDNSASQGTVVEGFMDKERVFNNNDIVKDEGTPIWTILSNRYMTSGYRRLFEEAAPSQSATQTVTQ